MFIELRVVIQGIYRQYHVRIGRETRNMWMVVKRTARAYKDLKMFITPDPVVYETVDQELRRRQNE